MALEDISTVDPDARYRRDAITCSDLAIILKRATDEEPKEEAEEKGFLAFQSDILIEHRYG